MSLPQPRRTLCVLVMIATFGLVALTAPLSSDAGAQPNVVPQASLVTALSDDGTETIVTITLDPGTDPITAFEGIVSFDPDFATPTGCVAAPGTISACNLERPGMIRFGVAHNGGRWTQPDDVFGFSFTSSGASEVSLAIGLTFIDGNDRIEMSAGDPVMLGGTHAASEGGGITGTFTASGQGLFGTRVCAESNETAATSCVGVDNRGSYRIDGLGTGTYTVTAEYYTNEYDVTTVSDIEVVSPNLTQGVDGVLKSRDDAAADEGAPDDEPDSVDPSTVAAYATSVAGTSAVSGTVTTDDGTPVPAVLVCIEDSAIKQPKCGASRLDGTYDIDGLVGGNYVVTLTDPGGRFADQTKPRFGLNAQTHRSNVDFVLAVG